MEWWVGEIEMEWRGWGNWFIVKSPVLRWDGLGKGILSKMVPQGTWVRESYIGRMVFQPRLFGNDASKKR